MFLDIVFVLLALILTVSTALALYLGLFRAGRPGFSLGRKVLCGLSAVLISLAVWGVLYSHQCLGW